MAAVYSAPNDISIKPQPAQPPKLIDRLRYVLRAKHYSYRTEEAYDAWVRRFIWPRTPDSLTSACRCLAQSGTDCHRQSLDGGEKKFERCPVAPT